ncbi:hypothetical protein PTTG_08022 [Puccinia triticina 1-1 BBBD Race 1]|uniref:Uncharacterized protein n=2 Tax=Puccinia triticina TaxID=208348 RepID=A0A0C4F4I2_PUCT1|nr:hypothetical protein PTTG_08022 [Puccinia triticina 1-1 BBBD Race 1]
MSGVKLPHWTTLSDAKKNIREIMNMDLNYRTSIFDNKCYSLRLKKTLAMDLSNPIVNKHLEFYPEDPEGVDIYKLSQSKKWREEFPADICVQMIGMRSKHFYIFEPVQLVNKTVVIHIYFYTLSDGCFFSKCVIPKPRESTDEKGKIHHHLVIPQDLPFNSSDLITVDCTEFSLLESEIFMSRGMALSKWYEYSIWGE